MRRCNPRVEHTNNYAHQPKKSLACYYDRYTQIPFLPPIAVVVVMYLVIILSYVILLHVSFASSSRLEMVNHSGFWMHHQVTGWLAGYLLSFFSLQKLDSLHHLLHLHSIHCTQLFISGYLKVAIYLLVNGFCTS